MSNQTLSSRLNVGVAQLATPTASGLVTSYFPTIQSAIKSLSSAGYTVLTTDGYSTVLVSTGASQQTINLPAASSNAGRILTIKKTDSGAGTVLINRAGSDTIDGNTTNVLNAQYSYVTMVSDGVSLWNVIAVWDFMTTLGTNVSVGGTGVVTVCGFSGGTPITPGTWSYLINGRASGTGSGGFEYGVANTTNTTTGWDTTGYSNCGETGAVNANNRASFAIATIESVSTNSNRFLTVGPNSNVASNCWATFIALRTR